MKKTFHVSTVSEAKAVIQQLEAYIRQLRTTKECEEDIRILGLRVRTENQLRAAGISTLGQLNSLGVEELWQRAKIGKMAQNDIDAAFARLLEGE